MHKFLKYGVVAYIASTAFVLGAIQVIEPSDSMATTRSKINANFAELGGLTTNGLAGVLGVNDSAAGLNITDVGTLYTTNVVSSALYGSANTLAVSLDERLLKDTNGVTIANFSTYGAAALLDVWQVSGEATNGEEIVNFQTMTNYLATSHDLQAVLAAGNDAGGLNIDNVGTGNFDVVYVAGDAGYEDIKLGTEGGAINWESSKVGFGTTNISDTVGVGYFNTNNGAIRQGVIVTPTQIQLVHDLSNAVYSFRMGGASTAYMTPSNFYPVVDYDLGRSVLPWNDVYATTYYGITDASNSTQLVNFQTLTNVIEEYEYMPKAGGTFTGSVYTARDHSVTPPASSELVSGVYVDQFNVANNLTLDRQSCFITNVAGTVYFETEKIGGGDIRVLFTNAVSTLNCTNSTGIGGRARVALTTGTDTVPQFNYVYATNSGATAYLTSSTTYPSAGSFALLAKVVLQSAATTLSNGAFALQRASDDVQRVGGRGRIDYMSERLRLVGALWYSGVAATVTDDAAGNITVATSSGIVYQMHRQAFDAMSDPATMYIANEPTTPYTTITNLNQITQDADGDAIGVNKRFGVRLMGYMASGDDGVDRMFITLPTGTYGSDSEAIADVSGYDVNTIPTDIRGATFNIARIVLNNTPTGLELIETQDKRGELVNATGSASGSTQSSEFPDTAFRVYDDGDVTKEVSFQASGITAGQTRVLTVQDSDGTLAYISDLFTDADVDTNALVAGAIQADGSVTWVGDDNHGGNDITGIGTMQVSGDAGYEDIKLGTEGGAINWESSKVGFGTTNISDTIGVGYFNTNNGTIREGVIVTPTQIQLVHDLSNAVYRFRLGGANTAFMTTSNFYPGVSNDYDLGSPTYQWKDVYAAGTVTATAFGVGTNSTTMSSRLIGGTNFITFTIGGTNFNLALE